MPLFDERRNPRLARFVSMGVDPAQAPETRWGIVLANAMAAVFIALMALMTVIYAALRLWPLAAFVFGLAVALALGPALNAAKRPKAARSWLLLASNLAVLVWGDAFVADAGVEYLFVPLAGMGAVFFGPRERAYTLAGICVSVALFVLSKHPEPLRTFLDLHPVAYGGAVRFAIDATSFLCTLVIIVLPTATSYRSTAAMRASEERTRAIFAGAPVGIFQLDRDGKLRETNAEACRMLGLDAAEVADYATRLASAHPDDVARYVAWRSDALAGKDVPTYLGELRLRHNRTGETVHAGVHASVLRSAPGTVESLVLVMIDLTERKRADALIARQQETLLSAAKMSAIGEMAANIGHEINNPVAIIHARAHLVRTRLQQGLQEPEKLLAAVDSIAATAMRIAKIVNGLKACARDGSRDPVLPVRVVDVVTDALEICQAKFRDREIKVEVAAFPEDLTVAARQVQISQILLNLLSNAYDAVLELPAPHWVRIGAERRADGNVELRVTDCGGGIPDPVAERIMQPLFTTKSGGRGTGLGLSVSHTIAVEHGGDLRLDRGAPHTTFVLTLPAAASASGAA